MHAHIRVPHRAATRATTRAAACTAAAALLIVGSGAVTTGAVADGEHPGLSPSSVEEMLLPGESFEVEKTVHTPDLPPVLDVCLVIDLSGSYVDDLPNIKMLAPGIWDDIVAGGVSDLRFGLATFVDFPFDPWGTSFLGDYAYRLDQQLTATKADWVAAVDAMSVKGGNDGPESQYEALYQLATGAGNDVVAAEPDDSGDVAAGQACSFREDATKVVMLSTDAPFHDAGDPGPFPYPGASAGDTEAALQAAGIKVVGLQAPGSGTELDALAAATGGAVVPTTSTSDDIAEAILQALEEIDVEVSMTSDCSDPITTTFAPASQTVENGQDAVFTETISVASDAPGGVYTCRDWALVDGMPMTDAAGEILYETKTILVPENFVTGGGNITNGEKGRSRNTLLTFGGNAGYMADGTVDGSWSFNFHDAGIRFHTTEITGLQFADTGLDPEPPAADADTVTVTADARANQGAGWEHGCQVEFTLQDGGEPQEDAVVAFSATCPSGFSADFGDLTGGNIQIHDGTKG